MKHAAIIKPIFAAVVMAAVGAWADTWKDPATGYTWTYRIVGDGVEIYGTGNPNWSGSLARTPAISPKPTGTVVIPSALDGRMVTSIGTSAFLECNGLTGVKVPDSVTSIGDYAFYRCTSLASISIPDGVTNIGSSAFCVCTGLKNIVIPKNVRNVGYEAFAWCGFSSVVIPDSVSNIEGRAFFRCNDLESVTFGTGLSHVGSGAFGDCSNLMNVYVGDLSKWCGISFADSYANPIWIASNFYVNGSLIPKDVTIPAGVTNIGDYAFYRCKRLTSVTIPKSVMRIGKEAFSGCSSLCRVNVADIGKWCAVKFAGFESNPLYYACTLYLNGENVTTLTIPDGVTSIGYCAFIDCRNITKVSIPNSVTNIGAFAFAGCNSAIYDTKTVPGVKLVDGWAVDHTESIIDELSLTEVHGVADYAFSHCNSLKRVIIGDAVVHLGTQSFMYCSGLSDVIIGDRVTDIRKSLFLGCTNLTNVVIGNSVTSIDEDAFYDCRKLSSVVIPDSVTNIASRAFWLCATLKSITIGSSVTRIGVQAFAHCNSQAVVMFKGTPPVADSTVFGDYGVLHGVYLNKYADEWLAILNESRMWYNLQMRMEGCVILRFDPNGGRVEPSLKEIVVDESVDTLPTPIRNGFMFSGWWTSKEGGSQVVESTVIVEDTIIFAHWIERTEYAVTFDANGGNGGTTRLVANGTAVGTLPVPTRDGHTFEGWYTARSGGNRVSDTTVVISNVTWYAHWKVTGGSSSGGDSGGGTGESSGGGDSGSEDSGSDGSGGGDSGGGGSGGDGFIGGGTDSTDGDTFIISTEEDFYEYIKESRTMGKTYVLANDLTLTGKHIVQYAGGPVDTAYHFPVAFYGTLKGNGHTIRLASSCTWIAVFGDFGGATIENVTFVLTPQAAVSEYGAERTTFSNVLVSVGLLTGGDLTKCTFAHCEVNYAGNRDNSYRDYVYGCFGGKADGCRFVDCKGTGVFPRVANASIGGFVREAVGTTFDGCRFEGTIESNYGAGGLAAKMTKCLVQNCEVNATIAGPLADGQNASGWNVGGIAGTLSSSTVQVCRVVGSVSQLRQSEENVGGIAGFAEEKSLISICLSSADIVGRENVGGIVGYLRGSDIENVESSGTVKGCWNVGGIVGQSVGSSRRANIVCSVASGAVIGLAADSSEECRYLGGFAGHLEWSDVSWCCATGRVNCTGKSLGLGGFVGEIEECTRISTSYATGSVVGDRLVGGFSGAVYAPSEYGYATIQIRNCYARGAITETTTSDSHGVAAFAADIGSSGGTILVENCYATGKVTASAPDYDPFSFTVNTDALAQHGGLSPILGEVFGVTIGITGLATSSYWDTQTTGQTQSGLRGAGKTTAEMGRQSTYVGWDFNTVWIMKNGYPILRACPDCAVDPAALGGWGGGIGDSASTSTPTLEDVRGLFDAATGAAPAAASEYNGYLYDEDSGEVKGTIQVKVGKPGKKDGKASVKATVVIGTKKVTLKAKDKGKAVINPNGPTEIELVGGEACEIVLGAEGISGTYSKYFIDGSRNFFAAKSGGEAANAVLGKWLGAVNIVWDGGSVNVSIAKKGKAKVKGTLADGKTKVSAKAVFLVGEEWCAVPVAAPKANLAFTLWLSRDGRTAVVEGLGDGAIAGKPGALAANAAFHVSKTAALWSSISGTVLADYIPDGFKVASNGGKWALPKAGKIVYKDGMVDESKLGKNPSGLKLTYKAKDGSFKGSFKVYAADGAKVKATTVNVTGVMVNGVGYGTATVKGKGSVAVTIK